MSFKPKNVARLEEKDTLDRVESILMKLTDTPSLNKGLPRIYRFSTISQRFDVPKSTLRLELESGRLQGFKIGHRWYVTENAAINWLEKSMDPKSKDSLKSSPESP